MKRTLKPAIEILFRQEILIYKFYRLKNRFSSTYGSKVKPMFNKIFFIMILLQCNQSFGQGKIIMNGAKINVVNSAYVVTKDVSLNNGGTINIKKSTIKIAGSISNGGTFDVTNGTVEMNGSASQTIPANAFFTNKIENLIISNNVTLAGQDSLTGVLSFGALNSRTFSTGGFLTLKSTASGTANVADLTNNNTNSGNQVLGNVIVERYLSAAKKWRFLSIPTSTTQTIKSAWQEGTAAPNDNLVPGYGTQITGAGGTAAGFDVYTATPSMKTYNAATNAFVGIANTNATLINNPINNTIAYYVFVRGDRSATTFTSPVSPTVLRTQGVIKQGDQATITIAAPATAITAVGNPYPARIDLRKMTPVPSAGTKIYVWDPFATIGSSYGLGAYQTLTFDGSDFTVTPGGGSYGAPYNQNPNYLESSQAFFVGGNASAYNISFKEDIKASGNLISRPFGLSQFLRVGLFLYNNGVASLMDGISANISSDFSNALDDNDAYKILNSAENVSLRRNQKLLSVERHYSIMDKDTFYLNIGNMRVQNYQWQINMGNLYQPGLTGFLEDTYKHTFTPLNLNGSTVVNFNIENLPSSYAADRFRIVYSMAKVLPLTFTNVKAYQNKSTINVEWKVENQINIKQYEVEKSFDGQQFSSTNMQLALGNNNSINYGWVDENPSKDYNYYRIKSKGIDGQIQYSSIIKVVMDREIQQIIIPGNQLANGDIKFSFINMPAGNYEVKLLTTLGQLIKAKSIHHAQGSGTESLELNVSKAKGIYMLEIIQPDNKKVSNKIVLN